jgi:hypothetical protein
VGFVKNPQGRVMVMVPGNAKARIPQAFSGAQARDGRIQSPRFPRRARRYRQFGAGSNADSHGRCRTS